MHKKLKTKTKRHSTKDISLEISKSLLEKNHFATIRDAADQIHKEIYRYNPESGVYESSGVAFIKNRVEKGYWQRDSTNHLCAEVIGRIERSTYVNRDDFDSDPDIINLQNGLFNLNTFRLKPHSPEYLSRIQLPFKYNPAKKAPRFLRFLSEVQPDERVRELLCEEIAYCFFPDCRLEKAFIYVGDGSNGKSVFLHVLRTLLGRGNVSGRSLNQFGEERFARADLDGKIANIYPDLNADDLKTTGIIKALISGETITAENKFGRPFEMIPRAKHFYSCNKLPDTPEDRTPAMFRRWFITEWNVTFERGGKNEPDKNLTRKLTTPGELSGIFNLVLSSYRKLMETLAFSYEPTIEEVKKEWISKADIVQAFIDDRIMHDYNSCETGEDVREEYQKWCKDRNVVPKSNKVFHAEFEAKSGATFDRVTRWGGKSFPTQTYIWKKIRFKNLTESFS